MKIAGWFRRNNTLMAQAVDLQRQLQEAWDEKDKYEVALRKSRIQYYELWELHDGLKDQLHRVARERYQERELRLAAEELREHWEDVYNNTYEKNQLYSRESTRE